MLEKLCTAYITYVGPVNSLLYDFWCYAGESQIPIPKSSNCCRNVSFLLLQLLIFPILNSTETERTEFRSRTYLLITNPLTARTFT
jgi:hypothetical protein